MDVTQLRNLLLEASGFSTTNDLALIRRLFSCWIDSFSVEAMAVDDEMNAWWDRWASLRATLTPPTTEPTVPRATIKLTRNYTGIERF